MGFIVRCLFCFAVAFCPSSFAIISLGKRELGALVCSEFRITSVLWIFLVVPWVGLSYVDVAFTGHTHLHANIFCELVIHFYYKQQHMLKI